MDNQYQFHFDLYMCPTPAGAYYCVSGKRKTPARKLLQQLLQDTSTPAFRLENIQQILGMDDRDEIIELILYCQKMGWLGGVEQPLEMPSGILEEILPGLLRVLSDSEKVLLADTQGFYICAEGFDDETAEELSALSADIANMHDRHQNLIQDKLDLHTSAWSLVDAAGNSQIGFWPMYIGEQRFVLVIQGLPQMNKMQMTNLIWVLYHRYGG